MTSKTTYWQLFSGIISITLIAIVIFLVYGPKTIDHEVDVSLLPHLNVMLNSLACISLVIGYILIQSKKEMAHRIAMVTASLFSALFLTSYLLYHYYQAEPVKYTGDFPWIYYPILIVHILLAAAIAPLVLVTLYRGWMDSRMKHRSLAKWTYPIWVIVSVSGIVIYLMLYG